MQYRRILSLLAIVLGVASCKPKEATIHGSVFIATRGGESYKLALVEVGAYPDSVLGEVVGRRRAEAQALLSGLEVRVEQLATASRAADRDAEKIRSVSANPIGRSVYEGLVRDFGGVSLGQRVADTRQVALLARQRLQAANDSLTGLLNGQFFLSGLPAPLTTVKTDADGRFTLPLPPGRTGLVAYARREVGDVTEVYHWLVWIDLAEGDSATVMLSNDNLFETRCRTCYAGVVPSPK